MRIAFFGKVIHENSIDSLKNLIQILETNNIDIVVHEEFYNLTRSYNPFNKMVNLFNSSVTNLQPVDYFFSFGGDGTILNTLPFVVGTNIPVVGINTGRLGFLSTIGIDEMHIALSSILEKNYVVEKRSLLNLESEEGMFGNLNFALNECTIHKSDSSSMITIIAFLNGEYLNTYWADGLIVSTPTGSTAYSLSCGGPIVMPDSENFIITPISPHNLNVRPLVISDKDILTLKIEGRNRNFLISLDSRSTQVDSGSEITLRKSTYHAHLLRLKDRNFTLSLRNKLMWGIDRRN